MYKELPFGSTEMRLLRELLLARLEGEEVARRAVDADRRELLLGAGPDLRIATSIQEEFHSNVHVTGILDAVGMCVVFHNCRATAGNQSGRATQLPKHEDNSLSGRQKCYCRKLFLLN